jgi:hypothetical protein
MWINSAIPIAQQKSKYNNVALTSSSISFLHNNNDSHTEG